MLTTELSRIEVILGAYCEEGNGTRIVALEPDGDIAYTELVTFFSKAIMPTDYHAISR